MNFSSLTGLPFLILLTGGLVLYMIARYFKASQFAVGLIAIMVCLAAIGSLVILTKQIQSNPQSVVPIQLWGSLNQGGSFLLAKAWSAVLSIISTGLGICIISYISYSDTFIYTYKHIIPLILIALAGVYGLLTAGDLFTVYLFSEMLCISATGMIINEGGSENVFKAGIKYLFMGSTATLIILLGLSLAYRDSGLLVLGLSQPGATIWARVGAACFLVGMGLKIGFVPLHGWLPDAYRHAPNAISSLLAGFISAVPIFILPGICLHLGLESTEIGVILMVGSFINMFVGNFSALAQKNTKRVLAYSSIAYTGYLMFILGIGYLFDQPTALEMTVFFFIGHGVMKSLAFLSLEQIELMNENIHKASIVTRTAFFISIAGLASIPPLAGFTGKWLIILEALKTGHWATWIGVGILLLNTLISLGYYLPLIRKVFGRASGTSLSAGDSAPVRSGLLVPLVVLALVVIWIGVYPTIWLRFTGLFGG
jgi:formate hydrogenlyase subunit 3/multisubunit Na+/H+ antiporter MnhD subunit